MALESSHLDLCSSRYAQISDKRSGLTALGNFCTLIFGCEFLIESLRIDKVFNMRVVGIEFIFPKSIILLQSNDNSSLSHRFILAPFALLSHFQSDSNLSRCETLEQTYQDTEWNGN
ncbi:hypothetical protein PIB30_017085 [Stylosanthes scabra]|uniref:Uncharacterized protein n=1 Tax=Stylosanthes scabra TaxID=79078 RepID=A0ABU6T9G5_9FABA|nr:hypothetical protein [Stylosanthes scabra]